ncbi:MAG TPA: peroxiredoxin [Labilithrix sp.]|nr:peroxiredoxin [Labilithrix sp.]
MSAIDVGDKVPSFTLPDQDGKPFRLEDVLAKGPLVLFFYPKDGTPVCTAEACSFRDASGDFLSAGAVVAGVSSDDVASHRRFADQNKLDYPLLSDVGGALRKKLGVPRSMFGLAEGRVTYVIDRDGILRHRFESMLGASKHVNEALATVRSLGSGG